MTTTTPLADALNGIRAYGEMRGRRDEIIRAARAAGVDIAQVAREMRLSRPTVYEVLRMPYLCYRCASGACGHRDQPGPGQCDGLVPAVMHTDQGTSLCSDCAAREASAPAGR
jgi:hypothetical protein